VETRGFSSITLNHSTTLEYFNNGLMILPPMAFDHCIGIIFGFSVQEIPN